MTDNSLLLKMLGGSPSFEFKNGVYFVKGFEPTVFENAYGTLRSLEGRAYSDDVVRMLPEYTGTEALRNEWSQRRRSAQWLADYLLGRKPQHVIEIGCGNGWLTNYLSEKTGIPCCGIDIHIAELEQAVRVFGGNQKICFLGLNPEQTSSVTLATDFVVMAAASQYFPNIRSTIENLLDQLDTGGEIHILDSPFYPSRESAGEARQRSRTYFEGQGVPGMIDHYFHHTFNDFDGLNFSMLHDPSAVSQKFFRFFKRDSVRFPWVRIRKTS